MTWCNLALQVTDINSIIVIADHEYQSWNEHEKNTILNEYFHLTAMNGMYVRDSAIARVFLGPTVYFQQKNIFPVAGQLPVLFYDFNDPNYLFAVNGLSGIANTTSTGPNSLAAANTPTTLKEKVPRPPNAFILYRKYHHPSIVAKNPGIHNNAVSTIIGKMWSAEKPEILAEWKVKAEDIKEEHHRKYPDYHYQPRRPAEKKRRKSKKNLEASTAPNLKAPKPSASTNSREVASSPLPINNNTFGAEEIDAELQNTRPLSDSEFSQLLDEYNFASVIPESTQSQYPVFQEAERQISTLPGLAARMDNAINALDDAKIPGAAAYRQDVHNLLHSVRTEVLSFGPKLATQALSHSWI